MMARAGPLVLHIAANRFSQGPLVILQINKLSPFSSIRKKDLYKIVARTLSATIVHYYSCIQGEMPGLDMSS